MDCTSCSVTNGTCQAQAQASAHGVNYHQAMFVCGISLSVSLLADQIASGKLH